MHSLLKGLLAIGDTDRAAASGMVERAAQPIVIERERLYTPAWDEAFVNLRAILEPEAYAALSAAPKWMYQDSRPCAFAVYGRDGGLILVSEGLIDLISFCSYHAAAASAMALIPAREKDLEAFEHLFLQIISNHSDYGWPLLDSINATTDESRRRMVVSRECMTAFVLLHELGHIVLGHLDGRLVGVVDFLPRVADFPSDLHFREIEADDYAFRAIAHADALNVCSTLLSAWIYAEAGRRVTRGPSAHLMVTHPLSINRLNRLTRHLEIRGSRVKVAVDWLADLVEAPHDAGLSRVQLTFEDALARHRALLAEHRDRAAPYI